MDGSSYINSLTRSCSWHFSTRLPEAIVFFKSTCCSSLTNNLHCLNLNQSNAFCHLQVLVLGKNFRQSSRLACQFGPSGVDPRVTIPATFLNTSALLCISPPRLTPPAHPVGAAAAVEVTNNAAVGGVAAPWSTFSRSGVSFRYEATPEIGSVVPHLGPASGNFSVRVAGGPFPDTSELRWMENSRCQQLET